MSFVIVFIFFFFFFFLLYAHNIMRGLTAPYIRTPKPFHPKADEKRIHLTEHLTLLLLAVASVLRSGKKIIPSNLVRNEIT